MRAACAVVALLLTACAERSRPADAPRQVLLATATSAGEAPTTSYPGRTRASQASGVSFRVSGTLAEVSVREGEHVRRGQVVAHMDDRDYRTQLSATEAEYAQVKAEAERVMALWADSATSQNNYDKARYGLEQMTQKLRNHRDQLKDCVLTAPFDGYVQSILHEAHETVGAGMPVMRLFASTGVEIVIHIPAAEYLRREEFEGFTASFDALPGRTVALRLLSVARGANANQLYEVRLAPEPAEAGDAIAALITPGMATTVRIAYRAEGRGPVVVPASALFDDGQGPAVLVYSAAEGATEGTLQRRAVRVAFLHSDGSAELADGLTAGERVVVSGVHTLNDGETVRPFPASSATNVGGLL